jgi:hypothetical protein
LINSALTAGAAIMWKFARFETPREEVDALAYDLIVRHGLDAYDEAIHLSEVARFHLHSSKNDKLYRLAAHQIEISFETAWENTRQRNAEWGGHGEGRAPVNQFEQRSKRLN